MCVGVCARVRVLLGCVPFLFPFSQRQTVPTKARSEKKTKSKKKKKESFNYNARSADKRPGKETLEKEANRAGGTVSKTKTISIKEM